LGEFFVTQDENPTGRHRQDQSRQFQIEKLLFSRMVNNSGKEWICLAKLNISGEISCGAYPAYQPSLPEFQPDVFSPQSMKKTNTAKE